MSEVPLYFASRPLRRRSLRPGGLVFKAHRLVYLSTLGSRVIKKPRRRSLRPGLWNSSQFKNNHFTEMCSGTEAGSYVRRIDSCITQLQAQGPSRTCNESKEEEEARRDAALCDHVSAQTLNPTPSTLNPKPYALNPKPYTLHPTP